MEHSPDLQFGGGQGQDHRCDQILAVVGVSFYRVFGCLGSCLGADVYEAVCVCVCVLVLVCLPCSPLFDCLDLSTVAAPHSLRVSCTLICSWPPSPLALLCLCLSLIVFLSLSFACFHFVFEQKFASAY